MGLWTLGTRQAEAFAAYLREKHDLTPDIVFDNIGLEFAVKKPDQPSARAKTPEKRREDDRRLSIIASASHARLMAAFTTP